MEEDVVKSHGRWYLRIALGCILISGADSGLGMLPMSLYTVYICDSLGITRGDYSLTFTCLSLGCTLAAIAAGKMLKRLRADKLILLGGLCCGSGYMLIGMAKSRIMLYLGGFLFGVGDMWACVMAVQIIVTNWFYLKRGFVIGLTAATTNLVSAVFNPLMVKMIGVVGWRMMALITGCMMVVLIAVLGLILLKDQPQRVGLKAYGGESKEAETAVTDKKSLPFNKNLFALILLSYFLIGFANQAIVTQEATIIVDKGFSVKQAAWAMSIYSVVGMINSVLAGVIADRFGFKTVIYYCGICFAVGCLLLVVITAYWQVLIAAALSCALAAIAKMYGMMSIIRVYGAEQVKRLNGYLQCFLAVGCMLGPAVAGYGYTLLASYNVPLLLYIGASLTVLILSGYIWRRSANNA